LLRSILAASIDHFLLGHLTKGAEDLRAEIGPEQSGSARPASRAAPRPLRGMSEPSIVWMGLAGHGVVLAALS